METIDVVRAIMGGAPVEEVQKYVDEILATKSQDAIDVRKVELASNLLTPETSELDNNTEENSDEISTNETEVGGDADVSDDVADDQT
jgi:hypothetical protein